MERLESGGIVLKQKNHTLEYSRQAVKGVFFCKPSASKEACRKLVQDLGCMVVVETSNSLTIQTSRNRLKQLKDHHLANEDDKCQISSRLKAHFERILIGGTVRR